ncbi:MAG: hypothetical protein LBS12_03985 [Prevotellaceae bacterium]|nr:hypothetical protein [Prevotellaceae bacterium]
MANVVIFLHTGKYNHGFPASRKKTQPLLLNPDELRRCLNDYGKDITGLCVCHGNS